MILATGYRRGEEFVMYKPSKNAKDLYKIVKDNNDYHLMEHKP